MAEQDLSRYGPALAELLSETRTMPLGPGKPNRAAAAALQKLTLKEVFDGERIRDEAMAEATLAGVWLLHNYLDESHRISQSIPTPTGSYWHAIMHRREPDHSNAKYWFRRVGRHEIFDFLAAEAAELAAEAEDMRAIHLSSEPAWDPFDFVDLCELGAAEGGDLEALCERIQMCEWWLLFDHCYRSAIREPGPA